MLHAQRKRVANVFMPYIKELGTLGASASCGNSALNKHRIICLRADSRRPSFFFLFFQTRSNNLVK
jgi:hypothetical protein